MRLNPLHASRGLLLGAALSASAVAWAGDAEPLRYDKGYITRDTTWSGNVILRGQTVVRRGSTLTILPGTMVKFEWTDEDGDGIGDGELTVEGRLVARGTRGSVITFTSGRERPRKKDWTFVQVSMNRDAVIEYCVFEYAFTGLQVHFSTAVVRDSVFRNNFEGIRFSTSDAVFENNDIVGNDFGIRCESHESRTVITRNRIEGNGVAFFPVEKNRDTVKISGNNVAGSGSYHVKLGVAQKQDLDFSGNWWGTADPGEIASRIYDRSREASLGAVKFVPFLEGPAGGCGVR